MLAFPQRQARLMAIGNILDRAVGTGDDAVLLPDTIFQLAHITHLAAGPDDAVVECVGKTARMIRLQYSTQIDGIVFQIIGVDKWEEIFLALVDLIQRCQTHSKNSRHFLGKICGSFRVFIPFPVADINRARQGLISFLAGSSIGFHLRNGFAQPANFVEQLCFRS